MKKLLLLFLISLLSFSQTPCLDAVTNVTGLIGEFIPQCEDDGSYSPIQCWGSTGYCWCVDENGVEITGTSIPAWQGNPDCNQENTLCDSIYVDIVEVVGNSFEITVSLEYESDYWFGYCGFIITNNQGDTIASENLQTAANAYGLGPNMIETRYLDILQEDLEFPIQGEIHLVEGLFAGNPNIACSWDVNINFQDDADCNPLIGVWYDSDNSEYVEITEDVINIYGYEDELLCWDYWSIEYLCISEGVIEILNFDDGEFVEVSFTILDGGSLQIIDPADGEVILLSPLDEMPDFTICDDNFTGEGCEDIQGQWVGDTSWVGDPSFTVSTTVFLEIDEYGIDVFTLVLVVDTPTWDPCYTYQYFVYDELENMDVCTVFTDVNGSYYPVGDIYLNENQTISLIPYDELVFPFSVNEWSQANFNPLDFEICSGCTDPNACNYDEAAISGDDCYYGVECLVSPCSVSEAPYVEGAYCVDDYCNGCCAIWYYQDGTVLYNSCEDDTDLSETQINKKIVNTIDLLGRSTYDKGFQLEIYNDGTVKKKYVN